MADEACAQYNFVADRLVGVSGPLGGVVQSVT
jgi:hypothetical protein